ncbi:2Fe-2S iron-sulfur cluster-binding protein [Thiohalomonas denitrificans]|uniref:CDP-4-dehydro-6-deoxyglucose reductase n=1 Tax=Thiohalomonas denitrificans TaxID=415747 RepID=A0A1G5Q7L7_9GAMM|nr:2Fe-2S iron-sulfur cluster-binding protein [Thiohalomonas denitrificans]SCZ57875.1 CDP-4-dehydro-6-deoxyglucose reductase [Thiohalomonas denitrificans]
MSYRVQLLPSGRTFTAEAHESLLDAGLRSGVNLPYSCAGGSCGECKARVLSGDVDLLSRHEYVIPEAEKLRNTILLCSNAPTSDVVLEVVDTGEAGEIPHQRIRARIASARRVGDYLLLQVRTPRTQTLRFLAGQYVTLSVEGVGNRPAAVGSCPCNGRVVQFQLHRDEDPVAAHLYEHADTGAPLAIEGPYGNFTLDESSSAPLVMVAEGTGFAPIKSLVEHFIALERELPVRLFWIAEPGGHYLENVCRSWRDVLDNFEVFLIDRTPGLEIAAVIEPIRSAAPDSADWYLACSPEIEAALREASSGRLRVYSYETGSREHGSADSSLA